jgi:hypothetical protein
VTAAPSPASAEPVPTGRRRGPIAPRPDDRLVLLEAIQRRDAPQARRLAERWVHRRGLASLEAFERQWLAAEAGPESRRWFGDLLQRSFEPFPAVAEPPSAGVAALSAGAEALGPEIRLEDLELALAAPPSPLPSVEEAFAALAAEFAPTAPAAPTASAPSAAWLEPESAPSPAELERIARSGLDQVDPSLLPPPLPTLSFAIAPAVAEPTLAATLDGPPQGVAAAEQAPVVARPWFGRVRGLLRTCVEEAIGGLSQAASPEVPPSPAALPEDSEAAPVDAEAASEAATEPLAPWPAFHPTASILAALPDPPAPAPAPAPTRWLPRLGLLAPSPRPAPAPADLADLRAWLPDAADDLPRAC